MAHALLLCLASAVWAAADILSVRKVCGYARTRIINIL